MIKETKKKINEFINEFFPGKNVFAEIIISNNFHYINIKIETEKYIYHTGMIYNDYRLWEVLKKRIETIKKHASEEF